MKVHIVRLLAQALTNLVLYIANLVTNLVLDDFDWSKSSVLTNKNATRIGLDNLHLIPLRIMPKLNIGYWLTFRPEDWDATVSKNK